MIVPIGVSNRHVHLTKETYQKLFGKDELTKIKDLNQPGEFASSDVVTVKSAAGEIEKVRILGPFRSYDQVEISRTDSYKLKLNPPVRKSGSVSGSEPVTLVGPAGEVELSEGLIIANRHLHMTTQMANELGVVEDQVFTVTVNNTDKKGSFEVFTKILDAAYFEVHIDTDDANGFLLSQDAEVEINIEK